MDYRNTKAKVNDYMRNLKMTIQYDGGRYKGWQRQKEGESTIPWKIENVLKRMTGEEIQVIGCGRTDAGVHAENYIANFHTESELSVETMMDYLYEFLPEDIVVKSIKDTTERFHARYNAKGKTYVYRINNAEVRNVFNRKYAYHTSVKLNLDAMREGAKYLVGTHDFQSFTSQKPKTKSTERHIKYININKTGDMIEI